MRNIMLHLQNYLTIAGVAFFICLFLYWLLGPHRSHWKALNQKGYGDVASGKINCWKAITSLYFVKFNRTKTIRDFENDIIWLSQIFNEEFFIVRELRWPRLLGLKSIMKVSTLNFPEKVKTPMSQDVWNITIGKTASGTLAQIKLSPISEIFISGLPGSGKSFCAKNILEHFKFHKLEYVVATSKPFDYPDHHCLDICNGIEPLLGKAKELWSQCEEFKKLLTLNRKTHVKDIDIKPRLLMIDEAHQILRKQPKNETQNELVELVTKIIRQGRAYGLIVCIITQKAQKSELDIPIRDGCLVVGRVDTNEISNALVDSDLLTRQLLRGGVMVLKDLEKVQIIKGSWTD